MLCRHEARQLSDAFAAACPKPEARLIAVIHEAVEEEVEGFTKWWPHEIFHDPQKEFYKVLYRGQLNISSFICFLATLANPWSELNGKLNRAKSQVGDDFNMNGDGFTHGGLVVVKPRGTGFAYVFTEDNLGDTANPDEVLAAVVRSIGCASIDIQLPEASVVVANPTGIATATPLDS